MGLLQLGVVAIVDKRDVAGSPNEAIDRAFEGRIHLSARASESLNGVDDAAQARVGVLSAREWEVFRMYAHGMTVHQIAQKLDRSSKTISTQKRSTMRKLGLETEANVLDYARGAASVASGMLACLMCARLSDARRNESFTAALERVEIS